jgi:tetratricopeptide (TPR) repeat protein
MFLKNKLPKYGLGALVLILLSVSYGCGPDLQTKQAAHMQKGAVYLAEGKYSEAILEFRNAAAVDANDAQVYYQLGLASLKKGELGDLREAFRAFRKTVQLDATNLDAQIQLSKLHILEKNSTKRKHEPRAYSSSSLSITQQRPWDG